MKRKYTSYVLLGVLATFVLLLSGSHALAAETPCSDGVSMKLDSVPHGAKVYIQSNNQLLGITPVCVYTPSVAPRGSYATPLKFVMPGYRDVTFQLAWYMKQPYYISYTLYLAPLN